MKLACLFYGHQWRRGKCKRCQAVHRKHDWKDGTCKICHLDHVEHEWEAVAGKCQKRCSVCGRMMSMEHSWDGCKCTVCGQTRDEGHQWVKSEGICFQSCAVCGKRQAISHRYQPVIGICREKCAVCGDERRMEHVFENGICARCGLTENEAYLQLALEERGQTESLNYVEKITDPELIKKFIVTKKDHYVCLYSINYLSDDQVLASIAQDNTQDYEIRIKARAKIKDEAMRKWIEIEEDPVYRAMYDMDIRSGM